MRTGQRLRLTVKRLSLAPRTMAERNIYYLYAEIIFSALLSAAASFDGTYILRLGGSNTLVGLLSSLPSLLAIFLYLPFARILQRSRHATRSVVVSLVVTRLRYLLIAILPFFLARYLPESTVGILILATIPAVYFSTGWSPILSEVVPQRSRATVLSWRSILNSGGVALATLLAGRWLDRSVFPLSYQALYGVGLVGGLISVYFISRIKMPEDGELSIRATPTKELPWREALRATTQENQGFTRIIINTLLYNLGAWMVGPLYIIFFVRQLGAADSWVGLNIMLANLGVVVGYWIWRRLARRWGEVKTLLIALPLSCTYAFMVALVPDLSFILFAGFLISVFNPGVDLSHAMLFLDLLPKGEKYSATALYSVVMNVGAFVCPLVGIALSDRIGIVPTLLIGGILRILGALLFYLFPVKGEKPRLQLGRLTLALRRRGTKRPIETDPLAEAEAEPADPEVHS